MKKLLLIFLALSLGLVACKKKDNAAPNSIADNKLSALVNGQQWQVGTNRTINAKFNGDPNRFRIQFWVTDNEGILLQEFYLGVLNTSTAQRTIYSENSYQKIPNGDPARNNFCFSSLYLGYGDVVDNSFTVWEQSPDSNIVVIDSYDSFTQKVKGHFNLTMYRNDKTSNSLLYGYLDTLRFTNGTFDVKITN